jgi:hypothetical protein
MLLFNFHRQLAGGGHGTASGSARFLNLKQVTLIFDGVLAAPALRLEQQAAAAHQWH